NGGTLQARRQRPSPDTTLLGLYFQQPARQVRGSVMILENDRALQEFRSWIRTPTGGMKITDASLRSKLLGLLGSMLLVPMIFVGTTTYAEPDLTKPATVVFVCLHGSVKSQVAAAHFNRIAKERGLPVIAVSRGIAVDKEI